jgi:hypothetical protein
MEVRHLLHDGSINFLSFESQFAFDSERQKALRNDELRSTNTCEILGLQTNVAKIWRNQLISRKPLNFRIHVNFCSFPTVVGKLID